MKYYTGIGSRETPFDILQLMREIGKFLAERGWTLRSGGADGADKAFEEGCDQGKGIKEIFLPWKGFNSNTSDLYLKSKKLQSVREAAFELAGKYHPVWNKLNYGAKCLMARNGMQVLGQDLKTPTSFVICYSLGGFLRGGTSQALRIARDNKIPIFNMSNEEDLINIRDHLSLKIDFLESLSYSIFE